MSVSLVPSPMGDSDGPRKKLCLQYAAQEQRNPGLMVQHLL